MRRGGLCVYDMDAWCSHIELMDSVHLVAAVYIHPDAESKEALLVYEHPYINNCIYVCVSTVMGVRSTNIHLVLYKEE